MHSEGDNRAIFLVSYEKDWHPFCSQDMLQEHQLLNFTLVQFQEFMKAKSEMCFLSLGQRELVEKETTEIIGCHD